MSLIVDVAQAVVDALNAQQESSTPFSFAFTAERLALPMFTLEEMATLHVSVVPRDRITAILHRTQNQDDIKVDIAIQQKLAGHSTADVDPLLALVQEISDFLDRLPMAGAAWMSTENKPIYAPEHLREKRMFTSVLTVTYRIWRKP